MTLINGAKKPCTFLKIEDESEESQKLSEGNVYERFLKGARKDLEIFQLYILPKLI